MVRFLFVPLSWYVVALSVVSVTLTINFWAVLPYDQLRVVFPEELIQLAARLVGPETRQHEFGVIEHVVGG